MRSLVAPPDAPIASTRPPLARRAPATSALRQLLAVIVLAVAASVVAPIAAPHAAAATVIHVAPGGDDGGTGGATDPVRTVQRAVQLATDGDVVEIDTGTYRESVQVYRKEVHLRAAPGATVVFDGAIPVDGWVASGGDWHAAWTTEFERAGTPHVTADRPEAGWPEQFFLDGEQLAEVTSREAVVPGTFFHDVAADRVWIGDDPSGRLVEGSALPWGIYLNHADGSSIRDVEVRRYATPYTKMAAVRAYADDLVIDGVRVVDNAYMGLSAIGARITVTDSAAIANGHLGMHAHRSEHLSILRATVAGNNRERFDAWHAAGGVKITDTAGFTMTDSLVVGNAGPGIWTDLDVGPVRIARNMVRDNMRSGIELELSFDAVVVDNAAVGNGEAGVWVLESRDVQVWHNALFGNRRDIWVEDGPRADVIDVGLHANTLGGGAAGAPALLSVDDWTEARSAADMRVVADHNAYWLPPGSPTAQLSRWANWPAPLSYSGTIEEHRAATGQDGSGELSTALENPFVRDAAGADYRRPAGAAAASPLPADVASAAGVATGRRFPAGPLSPWGAAPTTTGAPTTTVTPTTTGAPTTTVTPTTTGAPTTTVAPTTTGAPTTSAAPTTTVAPTTTAAPTTSTAPTTGGSGSTRIGSGRSGRTAVRMTVAPVPTDRSPAAATAAVAPGLRPATPSATTPGARQTAIPAAGWTALAAHVRAAS